MTDRIPVQLTLKTVRRLAIAKQHLSGTKPKNPGPGAILALMKDLRYLQLDPTSTVASSHLLVLWSRLGKFRAADLDRLLWKDKKLFEYWARAASIVLTEDYPFYRARMNEFLKGDGLWERRLRTWMKANSGLREYVTDELRRRGPLYSREFEEKAPGEWGRSWKKWGLRRSSWSGAGSITRMLEFMFHEGKVMVAGRQGRQKLWDLSERVLPEWAPRREMSLEEVRPEAAQLSLKALGVATSKQVNFHFLKDWFRDMSQTMEKLAGGSKIMPVKLEGVAPTKGTWYIHRDDVQLAESIAAGDWEPRTTLLSPFDNLISDRDRMMRLFGFFYRIEIYTPRAQRKHGFFVLPILDGDKLVGRIDPAMDREGEKLNVHAVHAETNAPGASAVAKRIAAAIGDLAEFLGARKVVYTGKVPEIWRSSLR